MKINLGIDPCIQQQFKEKAILHEEKALLTHARIVLVFFPLYGLLLMLGDQTIDIRDYIALVSAFLFSLGLYVYIRIVKRAVQKNEKTLIFFQDLYSVILTLYSYTMFVMNDSVSFTILFMIIFTFGIVFLNPIRYMIYVSAMLIFPSVVVQFFSMYCAVSFYYRLIDVLVISAFAIVVNQVYSRDRYRTFALESSLESERDTDSLTGLMNKGWFQKMLQKQPDPEQLAVAILIDLDNFKAVNDAFGHAAGDQFLMNVGEILKGVFRKEDHAARIGGDEFGAFFMVHTNDWDMIERIAELKAKTLLNKVPIQVKHKDDVINITFSIGICVQKMDNGMSPQKVLAMADDAMYEVKGSTKNGACLYIGDKPSRKIAGSLDTCQEAIIIE